ncbi:MAG: LLM class flavin-dependent oxidoreductase [Acidimicrobiia bacterium]|nr:LLM class flavin-dependent oxidoreductase [Acidimicrobiia bacterium]
MSDGELNDPGDVEGPTRFGAFIAPFHPDDESPTLQLHRDLDLVEHMERLGFDEAWIGEHHSGAYEIIGSPEVFIAAAAERTRRIRLGTGVSSLSYHHPLLLADRMCQLDHQSLGRVMLGVGPGQLPTDAFMMGIDPMDQRRRIQESLDVMVRLFRGEVVTERTDWFELREGRLQLLPFQRPSLEIAVASTISPAGASLAGRHGVGLLSLAATVQEGFDALNTNWQAASEAAASEGRTMDRRSWRLVCPMHIAESREEAEADLSWGVQKLVRYMEGVSGRRFRFGSSPEAAITRWRNEGFGVLGAAVIGTPEDAIARIEQLVEHTGGFGTFLLLAHDCAPPEATWRSYELFARYVTPHFQQANRGRAASLSWAHENGQQFMGRATEAVQQAIADHRSAAT